MKKADKIIRKNKIDLNQNLSVETLLKVGIDVRTAQFIVKQKNDKYDEWKKTVPEMLKTHRAKVDQLKQQVRDTRSVNQALTVLNSKNKEKIGRLGNQVRKLGM